jgi:DNA polymerase-3 subunit delta
VDTAEVEIYRGVVLVVGDEEYLVSRALETITIGARRRDRDADLVERVGSEIVSAELYELLSPSLFGGQRTVIIRSAHEIPAAAVGAVTGFLKDPGEDITLVLQHAGGARGKALLDSARRVATATITCAKLTRPSDRESFVRAEVKRARGQITGDAVSQLIDAVGTDLRELAAVAAQLASDSGGRIDADIVNAYHRGRAQVTGFTVADFTVAGDTARAVESLRWALAIGVAPVLIADALADGVRTIAKVSAAGRGNPNMLAGKLGMPPWKIERAQRQARSWSEPALAKAMSDVAVLNADVKGAAADADYALERAIRALTVLRGAR